MHFDTAAQLGAPTDVLSRYQLFNTRDVDEARVGGAHVFCEHALDLMAHGNRAIHARMCFTRIKGVGLGRMTYGGDVVIEPGRLDSFALVQMPLSGHERVRSGNIEVDTRPGVGSVIGPDCPVSMQHRAGTEKLFIRIDRDALEHHCAQHLGGSVREPIDFELAMDLTEPAGQRWMRMVNWLFAEAEDGDSGSVRAGRSPLLAAHVEQMLISMLLMCQPHNYSERLAADAPAIAPAFIKRIERYIEEHADEPLTIVDLAEHAGVSSRSLFAGFRRFRNNTPMNYLRDVRLARVREALLQACPGATTVTREALRWGFGHLGHFTTAYKRRFGESPSETLARG